METRMRYSPQTQLETSEGNTMELTTDEIIARLMNLSVKLDGEMRFEESATLSQALALIMTLRNATERLRHPSNSDIVSAIRSQNKDELKQVIRNRRNFIRRNTGDEAAESIKSIKRYNYRETGSTK